MTINLPSRGITAVTFGLIDAVVALFLCFAQKEEGSVCIPYSSLCKQDCRKEGQGTPLEAPQDLGEFAGDRRGRTEGPRPWVPAWSLYVPSRFPARPRDQGPEAQLTLRPQPGKGKFMLGLQQTLPLPP